MEHTGQKTLASIAPEYDTPQVLRCSTPSTFPIVGDIHIAHTRDRDYNPRLRKALILLGIAAGSMIHYMEPLPNLRWGYTDNYRIEPSVKGRPVFHDDGVARRKLKEFHALGKDVQVSRKAQASNAGRYKHTQFRDAKRKLINERYVK